MLAYDSSLNASVPNYVLDEIVNKASAIQS